MSQDEKHPHVDRPSDDDLAALLGNKGDTVREVYLAAHRLVLETLPEVAYATDRVDGVTGYGARQYGYGGWGLAALGAHAKWASLMFMRGADLDDPDGLLEGAGKKMRHVKLRSLEQFEARRGALRRLIEAATRVDEA
jgi:hypothetical protein